nr:hypothetical protein [Oculatellaceae cyanobacterium Prado106]
GNSTHRIRVGYSFIYQFTRIWKLGNDFCIRTYLLLQKDLPSGEARDQLRDQLLKPLSGMGSE